MKVILLATVRKPELLPAALLVMETIRIGFPTADIEFVTNGWLKDYRYAFEPACKKVGAYFTKTGHRRHDYWVQQIVWNQDAPFVICDTDMVFFDKVEDWAFDHPWAGAFQPQYRDPFTKMISLSRLHTSLLFVRPDEIRDRMIRYTATLPKAPTVPEGMMFFRQQYQPIGKDTYFADTGANLYQTLGGASFNETQLDAFAHLHAGTWSDILGMGLREMHEAIYSDRELARGLWRKQAEFYKEHAV